MTQTSASSKPSKSGKTSKPDRPENAHDAADFLTRMQSEIEYRECRERRYRAKKKSLLGRVLRNFAIS